MLAADVVQIFVHWWAMDLKNVTRTVLNSFFWSYTLNNLALFSFFQICVAHNSIRPPDIDFCHLYTLWIRLVTYRKVVKHYSFQRVGMEWKNTLEHQQSMVWFEKVALVEITAIPRLTEIIWVILKIRSGKKFLFAHEFGMSMGCKNL